MLIGTIIIFYDSGIVAQVIFNGTDHTEVFNESGKLFYHNDHLGSTSVLTNESGDVVENSFYGPYGQILDGANLSRYSYEGKEFSDLTNDYDFDFRKYDPRLGIFTQPDAVHQNIYDPQTLNRYAFERRNPYKFIDDDGKVAILAPLLIAGLTGFIGGGLAYFATTSPEERTINGFLAYAGGGALGGVISVGTVLAAPLVGLSTGGATILGGAAGGFASQGVTNLGTGQSFTTDLGFSTLLGAGTAGFGKKVLPYSRTYLIKYSSSYFTTKTGKTFIANTASQQVISSYGSIINDLLQNSNSQSSSSAKASSSVDISKGVSSGSVISSGGGKNNLGSSGKGSSIKTKISNGISRSINKIKSIIRGIFRRR